MRGTKTDARNVRAELSADISRGVYVSPAREALGNWLEKWLERIKPPHSSIKIGTWKSYESHCRVHLLTDPIADRKLAALSTTEVEDLFVRLAEKGLSPATVDAVRRTLRAALNAHPRIARNPVRGAKHPKVPRHEIHPDDLWTPPAARRFLAHSQDEDPDTAVLVRLALDSGARLGELLALTWPDISLTNGTVRIRRSVSQKRLIPEDPKLRYDTPKNERERTIQVDTSTIAALRELRERQNGEPVADVGKLVFRRPTRSGFQPWRLDVTTHLFQRLSNEAKVPRMPFHNLRHCCASWLLADGMDVVAVSERLGHWSPSLTHGLRTLDQRTSSGARTRHRRRAQVGERFLT